METFSREPNAVSNLDFVDFVPPPLERVKSVLVEAPKSATVVETSVREEIPQDPPTETGVEVKLATRKRKDPRPQKVKTRRVRKPAKKSTPTAVAGKKKTKKPVGRPKKK